MSPESKAIIQRLKASLSPNKLDKDVESHIMNLEAELAAWKNLHYEKHCQNEILKELLDEAKKKKTHAEITADLDAFIQRAGFTYGWANLESWARRMAEKAIEELNQLQRQGATDKAQLEKLQQFFDAVVKNPSEKCWCETCRPITLGDMRMVLCPDCGNKRCPKANNHDNACTGSNELGQPGSSYPTPDASVLEAAKFPPSP